LPCEASEASEASVAGAGAATAAEAAAEALGSVEVYTRLLLATSSITLCVSNLFIAKIFLISRSPQALELLSLCVGQIKYFFGANFCENFITIS
jgi:hypothetical protein